VGGTHRIQIAIVSEEIDGAWLDGKRQALEPDMEHTTRFASQMDGKHLLTVRTGSRTTTLNWWPLCDP
jgi:hypothetical protein